MSLQTRADFDSYFPVDDYDNHDFQSDLNSLPFPVPLHTLRLRFREDEFECDSFLLQHQRHGQLDDLLAELRSLSRTLEQELTKGVEDDYEDFIALGKLDDRRINELYTSITSIRSALSNIESELSEDLNNIELVMSEKILLAKRKREARSSIRVVRTLDELSYLLNHDDDLEQAVEALEYLRYQVRSVPLPESEEVRYNELVELLHRSIMESGGDKMERAVLLRRIKASTKSQL